VTQNLLYQIIAGTGLPEDWVLKKLNHLILAAGANPKSLGLEELRHILADYLQEVMLEAKKTNLGTLQKNNQVSSPFR